MQNLLKSALYISSKSFYEQYSLKTKYFILWTSGTFGIKRAYLPMKYIFNRANKFLSVRENPLKKVIKFQELANNRILSFLNVQKALVGSAVGFKQYLRVKGVGYKLVVLNNNNFEITAGYSHLITGHLHPESQTKVTRKLRMVRVKALNLCSLKTYLSHLRNQKKADPYRVKGIRFRKEKIIRKLVKKRRCRPYKNLKLYRQETVC